MIGEEIKKLRSEKGLAPQEFVRKIEPFMARFSSEITTDMLLRVENGENLTKSRMLALEKSIELAFKSKVNNFVNAPDKNDNSKYKKIFTNGYFWGTILVLASLGAYFFTNYKSDVVNIVTILGLALAFIQFCKR